ncbi:type I-B CRISPR-associated protein Cas7/Csh2 [Thermoanaerobacterium sp. RBIITD]|uniref:type I-B CRISPR-associated protein Cas7/Csh2 n=1 Tax=Thermoanaerobacterium sp. RBIITD TaxID=1550240 RepID=UPI000BB6DB76|nr:type I-B CRISPR-associated protein Cas7/Csh2 [Thermoanaerobacterium sp. RBIITD]SNX53629.1 CRISPR-associated protein Csh2 [Thermoanaerobacterium sp. RBIITD]
MSNINNRSEVLFLYDVSFANPNGDPVDENKPRIDEETGQNIVTDVRLKRTIRDYLINYKDMKDRIFVKEIIKDDGKQKTREERIEEEKINNVSDVDKLIKKYIDLRLFGATIGLKAKKAKKGEENEEKDQKGTSITWTGPVQFKYGRSLHKVNITYVKGSTVMPSGTGKDQGTFTEKYLLPYSLIAFYGIINENAAKNQNIPLTEDDVGLMLEAMWNGTKNLMSNSKMGHMPRFLLQIIYKEGNYQMGELDRRLKFVHDIEDEEIRDIKDGKIDITELIDSLKAHKDKIRTIRYAVDDRVVFTINNNVCVLDDVLKDFPVEEFKF